MGLPENLRQKARAIFFAKQKAGGFSAKVHDTKGWRSEEGSYGGPSAEREAASTPEAAVGGGSRSKTKGASVRGICFAFQRGECTRGEKCIFRHAADDEGSAKRMQDYRREKQEAASRAKVEKLKKSKGAAAVTAANGTTKGAASFTEEQKAAMRAKPCRWFQKGNCSRGDACFFAHVKA